MTTKAKAKKKNEPQHFSVRLDFDPDSTAILDRTAGGKNRTFRREREREREGEKQKTALTTDGSETSHRTYWTMASHRNATSRRPFFFSFFFFFSSPPWERADRIEKKRTATATGGAIHQTTDWGRPPSLVSQKKIRPIKSSSSIISLGRVVFQRPVEGQKKKTNRNRSLF